MSKKLYTVTAKSVVYAHTEDQAREAIYKKDPLDLFLVSDISAITRIEDIPAEWESVQCALDADRLDADKEAGGDPWTLDSIEGILKRKNNNEDTSALLERIGRLETLVSKLITTK
jgi:hypothetical protein